MSNTARSKRSKKVDKDPALAADQSGIGKKERKAINEAQNHTSQRGREREVQSQEALINELQVRLDDAEYLHSLQSKKIAELTKKSKEKDDSVGQQAHTLVNILGQEHAQRELAKHQIQNLEEKLRTLTEANRKLTERLVEQKKADQLRAQEVEQMSQKLLSLQEWKAREVKQRLSEARAAAKPILNEPCQRSRDTEERQSACETNHDLHDDEPERTRLQATSDPASM